MLSGEALLWIKAFHIIAVTAWMAGVFYLPRLFVYHRDCAPGSEASELFKVMERRLLKAIMTPAMLVSIGLGLVLIWELGMLPPWLILKLSAALGIVLFHLWMAGFQRAFARDERPCSQKFFRIVNEVPTLLLVVAVISVVVKPFG